MPPSCSLVNPAFVRQADVRGLFLRQTRADPEASGRFYSATFQAARGQVANGSESENRSPRQALVMGTRYQGNGLFRSFAREHMRRLRSLLRPRVRETINSASAPVTWPGKRRMRDHFVSAFLPWVARTVLDFELMREDEDYSRDVCPAICFCSVG